jgi:hypothetical protein
MSQKKIDTVETNLSGYNAVAGITMNAPSMNVGVEIKYTIPDGNHMETGFYSVGGNLTSGVHISL